MPDDTPQTPATPSQPAAPATPATPAAPATPTNNDATKTEADVQPSLAYTEITAASELKSQAKNTDTNYEALIRLPFNKGAGQAFSDGTECVDVVTEYYWVQNKPKPTDTQYIQSVPFLYAVEYRQKYGVTATNLYNNINAVINGGSSVLNSMGLNGQAIIGGIQKGLNKVKTTIGTALDAVGDNTGSIGKGITNGIQSVGKVIHNVATGQGGAVFAGNTHLATDLLHPYYYLYSLEATKKKYCFPFLTEGASSWNIANSFGDGGAHSILSKSLTNALDAVVTGVAGIAADVGDLLNLAGGNHQGFSMYNVEKAKAFSFPSGGKTVSVKFPLFNTIKQNEWQNNYRFIVLFGIRNMLFRKNNIQYYPPLIYDVSIPGFGRLPLSYVKTFSVKPVGMTRVKSINLNLGAISKNENKTTTVVVPEAWVVQIDFECLIADSANLYLSSMVDLPVNANVVSYSS